MALLNPGITKNYTAGAAVRRCRIVAMSAEQTVIEAASDVALSVGVTTNIDVDSGDPCDVIHTGIATVVYGGAVTRGAALTSDAQGRAIVAAAGDRVIGTALIAGASGEYGSVLLGIVPVLA